MKAKRKLNGSRDEREKEEISAVVAVVSLIYK